MNKFLSLIIVIMFLAYVPLGPVNYSSELSGIFIFLGQIQVIISNMISSMMTYIVNILLILVSNILPLVMMTYQMILSLPYDQINYWYVLLGLFIISYFREKFRIINNELHKLRKRLSRVRAEDSVNNTMQPQVDLLIEKSGKILDMLAEISSAADNFKNTYVRSKKIRRETPVSQIRNEIEENYGENIATINIEEDVQVEVDKTEEIISDDNISKIDLARAFVESNEKQDAIDLIKKIIDTGTEEEKHEAKLLYMQVK